MNCWAVGSLGTLRLKFTRRLRLRNPAGDYRARLFREIDESNPGLSFLFADPRNLPACFDLIPRPFELNPHSWEIILGQSHSRGKSKTAFADVKQDAAVIPAQLDETERPYLLPGMTTAFAKMGRTVIAGQVV